MRVSRQEVKDFAPWVVHAAHLWRQASNQIRYPVVATALELRAGGRVMSGLFQGLRAPHSGISPSHYAQLLGLYEKALVPAIEAVIARQPAVIIDVGAHRGCYAPGLAMRCPQSHVVAYEIDHPRAQLLRRFGQLNGLEDRVEIHGACTTESLAGNLGGLTDSFLLMDVEGAEDVLLDPLLVPGLRQTEILAEMHEAFVPGVTERLRATFAPTHRATLLHEEDAPIDAAMPGRLVNHRLLRRTAQRLTNEHRDTAMAWLHLKPNN